MRSRPPEAWMYLAMRLSTFCGGAFPTTGTAAASAARHSGTIRGIGDLSKTLNRDRKRTGPSADPRVISTVACQVARATLSDRQKVGREKRQDRKRNRLN